MGVAEGPDTVAAFAGYLTSVRCPKRAFFVLFRASFRAASLLPRLASLSSVGSERAPLALSIFARR